MSPITRNPPRPPPLQPPSITALTTSHHVNDFTTFITTPLWLIVSISVLSHSRSHPRTSTSTTFTFMLCLFMLSFSIFAPNHWPITTTTSSSSSSFPHQQQVNPPFSLPTLVHQNGPDIPPIEGANPSPTASVSPIPISPSPTPATLPPSPPAPTSPAPVPVQTSPVPVQQPSGFSPSRDRCAPGLRRMQAILLLELCFEFLFLFISCLADRSLVDPPQPGERRNVDISFRGYLFIRAIYAVPVLILNCSIYWIGGGPTGSCLSSYGEIQIAFAHLIFYILFCVFVVVIGIYRIDLYDQREQQAASTNYTPTSQSDGAASPPTRTESYFHSMGRRRRANGNGPPTQSGYEVPKFRFNMGCCAINF